MTFFVFFKLFFCVWVELLLQQLSGIAGKLANQGYPSSFLLHAALECWVHQRWHPLQLHLQGVGEGRTVRV